MTNLTWAIVAVAGAGLGLLAGYFLRKKIAQAQANSVEAKAEKMLTEAKTKQQELIIQAKEKGSQIIDEAKREEKVLRTEIHNVQQRLERRESMFDQKLLEFQDKQQKLEEKIDRVQQIKLDIEK